jgi:Flp pilus assembly protein TadD
MTAMQNPPAFAAILKQAVQQHRAGRLDDAERLYRDVLAVQPHQRDVHHNLGAVLARRGRLKEALPHHKMGPARSSLCATPLPFCRPSAVRTIG